jgi:hypothetical protein
MQLVQLCKLYNQLKKTSHGLQWFGHLVITLGAITIWDSVFLTMQPLPPQVLSNDLIMSQSSIGTSTMEMEPKISFIIQIVFFIAQSIKRSFSRDRGCVKNKGVALYAQGRLQEELDKHDVWNLDQRLEDRVAEGLLPLADGRMVRLGDVKRLPFPDASFLFSCATLIRPVILNAVWTISISIGSTCGILAGAISLAPYRAQSLAT